MPVEGVNGFLDVESAALRAPQVGIANTNPEHILSVGSNLYVSGDSSDVLTVKGNVVSEGLRLGFIEIYPSFDLEAITTVGNVTSNTIIFANVTTGFVTTANVEVGTANLFVDTTVGRVGVGTLDPEATLHVAGDTVVTGNLTVSGTTTTVDTQHLRVTDPLIELGKDNVTEIATDLGIVMTRPAGSSNVAIVYDETATSLNIGYTLGNASQAGISMESGTPLDVNIYGNVHVSSNLEVGTANLFVDTVNSRVGVGTTDPSNSILDVAGTLRVGNGTSGLINLGRSGTLASHRTGLIYHDGTDLKISNQEDGDLKLATNNSNKLVIKSSGNVAIDTSTFYVDAVNDRVGIGATDPTATLEVHNSATAANAAGLVADFTGPWIRIGDARTARTFSSGLGIKFHDVASTHMSMGIKDGIFKIGATGSDGDTLFPGGAADKEDTLCITTAGNVGIGTTSPQNKLAVVGNVTFGTGAATTTSAYHTGMLNVIGGGTRALLRIENNSSIGSPGIIFGEGGVFTEDTVPTIKKVQGTNDLAIMTAGNVGIGTIDPISIFHTHGGDLWDGSSSMASKVCATLSVARGGGASGAASTQDAGTGAILKFTHDGTGYRHVTMESVSEAN